MLRRRSGENGSLPVSGWTYRSRVLKVIPCPDELAEQVSLDIYNAVWPHDTLTMEDVRSFKASVRDHVDYLACTDGKAAGSAVAVIFPQRANRDRPHHRRSQAAPQAFTTGPVSVTGTRGKHPSARPMTVIASSPVANGA